MKRKKKISSPTKQKILLLLAGGLVLGLSRSFSRQKHILRQLNKAWEDIDRKYLYRVIREFHHERLVSYLEKEDGSIQIVLSEKGRQKCLEFDVDQMEIKKPARWDRKWRIVIFDIPEKRKQARNALRDKLKDLGFVELQKSTWAFPYPCEDEINFLVEFFEIRNHVRLIEANKITNEESLLVIFNLI